MSCKYCGNDKPDDMLINRRLCRACYNIRANQCHRAWRSIPANKEKRKAWAKRHHAGLSAETKARYAFAAKASFYGIEVSVLRALIDSANGVCQCCHRPAKSLNIDHDHVTGRVRGMLCTACNTGLGHLRADAGGLDDAQRYLQITVDTPLV